ncbi:unnamed protein product, partial [Didymodactylos carnosus]
TADSIPLLNNENSDDNDSMIPEDYVNTSFKNNKKFKLFHDNDSFVTKPNTIQQCLPNLHSLGELLLPCFCRQIFTLTVILSLLCMLVSYALAGSQAYATLFRIK